MKWDTGECTDHAKPKTAVAQSPVTMSRDDDDDDDAEVRRSNISAMMNMPADTGDLDERISSAIVCLEHREKSCPTLCLGGGGVIRPVQAPCLIIAQSGVADIICVTMASYPSRVVFRLSLSRGQ